MLAAFGAWGAVMPALARRGITPLALIGGGVPLALLLLGLIVLLGQAAGAGDVVLLEQDRAEAAQPMVAAAAGGDRALLQLAQARRRLAGVEDRRAGACDRRGEAGGEGGDAGEVAEEVQRRALRREQRAGAAAGEDDVGGDAVVPLALDEEVVDVLDAALAQRLGDDRQPVGDARLFLDDPRPRPRPRGDRRLRGDVAAAEVLGQRPRDQVLQRFGHRRSLDEAGRGGSGRRGRSHVRGAWAV